MAALTAPSHEDLVADLDKVTRYGLAKAQDRASLAALTVILTAVQEAPDGEEVSLESLLRDAVGTADDKGPGENHVLLYGLDGTDLSAEARYREIGSRTNFSHHHVARDKRREWNSAVAEQLREMFDRAAAQADGRIPLPDVTRERMGRLCAIAALQLAAAQLPDGSWPSRIDEPGMAGDVSLTSWAASALLKVLGSEAISVERIREWIDHHRHEKSGGFGSVASANHPPAYSSQPEIEPTPRETASAVKILNQFDEDNPDRKVGLGVRYLLQHVADRGKGWPKSGDPRGDGHVLTTAYVLDALLAVTSNVRYLSKVLDADDYAMIDEHLEGKVSNGLNWVALEQNSGGWGNSGEPEPYATAQVVCFLHQLITRQQYVGEAAIEYLTKCLQDGGLPEEDGGPPAIGPTAMMVFGLLRGTTTGCEQQLLAAINFLGRAGSEKPSPLLDVYSSTFALLLGGPEWRLAEPGWRETALEALKAHWDARADGGSPEEIASRTIEDLPSYFEHTREPLTRILEGSCREE